MSNSSDAQGVAEPSGAPHGDDAAKRNGQRAESTTPQPSSNGATSSRDGSQRIQNEDPSQVPANANKNPNFERSMVTEKSLTSPQYDPHDPLQEFNWEDFEASYDEAMETIIQKEAELVNDFKRLANYYTAWAQAGSFQDADRSVKRIKTRQYSIQYAEGDLQRKKEHFSNVMNAFRNAIQSIDGREI